MLIEYKNIANSYKEPTTKEPSKEMKVACEKFLQNLFRCRKLVVATV